MLNTVLSKICREFSFLLFFSVKKFLDNSRIFIYVIFEELFFFLPNCVFRWRMNLNLLNSSLHQITNSFINYCILGFNFSSDMKKILYNVLQFHNQKYKNGSIFFQIEKRTEDLITNGHFDHS